MLLTSALIGQTKNTTFACMTLSLENLSSLSSAPSQKRYVLRTGFATAAWAEGLRKRFNGGAILFQRRYANAICSEQKRGPLIYALCQYEFFVLYPVNPQTVAKYRQAFAPSRAKADPTDAHLLVELILKHSDKLNAWQPGSSTLRSLQQLVENRRMLVGEKVRLTNRITAALKGYYPQVLEWFEDKDTQVFCEFLTRYPSLKVAQAASEEELEEFFKSNHVVQTKTIRRRLEQIQQGVVLTEDKGIVEPFQLLVSALIAQLKILLSSITTFDSRIEELFASHPDAQLFSTLPGAGPHLAPRLLVAFGEERSRYQTAQDVLRYSGIAPVKESRRSASSAEPWAKVMGALAVELSKIFETDLCGVEPAEPKLFILGRSVLSNATQEGKDTSGCDSSIGIQVDTNCVSMLARQEAL